MNRPPKDKPRNQGITQALKALKADQPHDITLELQRKPRARKSATRIKQFLEIERGAVR